MTSQKIARRLRRAAPHDPRAHDALMEGLIDTAVRAYKVASIPIPQPSDEWYADAPVITPLYLGQSIPRYRDAP